MIISFFIIISNPHSMDIAEGVDTVHRQYRLRRWPFWDCSAMESDAHWDSSRGWSARISPRDWPCDLYMFRIIGMLGDFPSISNVESIESMDFVESVQSLETRCDLLFYLQFCMDRDVDWVSVHVVSSSNYISTYYRSVNPVTVWMWLQTSCFLFVSRRLCLFGVSVTV